MTAVYGSVAENATANAIVQAAIKQKRLDILVNNAGIIRDKLLGMISDEEIQEVFATNIIGLIKVTQLAARIMPGAAPNRSSTSLRSSGGSETPGRWSIRRQKPR